MHTYFPYTATHCNAVQSQQINRFMGATWQQSVYFPSKLHNLHGCPLQVLLRAVLPFFSMNNSAPGLEDRLLLELGRRMNFVVQLVDMHNQSVPWTEQQMLHLVGCVKCIRL